MGKVLLAYKSKEELDTYFETAELKPLTEHTIYKEKDLRKELAEIRKAGYAISEDQLELGLMSVAAPIRNMRGNVIAAINCSTNSSQTTREELEKNYLKPVLDAAEQISRNTEIELPF